MGTEQIVYMAAAAVVLRIVWDEAVEVRKWYRQEKKWKRRMKDVR